MMNACASFPGLYKKKQSRQPSDLGFRKTISEHVIMLQECSNHEDLHI